MNYFFCCWIHADPVSHNAAIGGTKVLPTEFPDLDIGRAHQVISHSEAKGRPVLILSWQKITRFQAEQYWGYVREVIAADKARLNATRPLAPVLQLTKKPETPEGEK